MAPKETKRRTRVDIEFLADHPEAIPSIARWIYEEWSFLYPGLTSLHVQHFLRQRLHKKELPITLVAFYRRKPVATVSLKEFELETKRDLTPWITSLYVTRPWRRKGVGSSLMKAAEATAGRLGVRKLFLFTTEPGLAAGFYAKLGWTIREEIQYRSFPVIIMEKELLPSRSYAAADA